MFSKACKPSTSTSMLRIRKRNRTSNINENYSTHCSSSNERDDACMLDETVSIFSSPERDEVSSRLTLDDSPLRRSFACHYEKKDDLNASIDIFDTTPESIVLSSSKESSRSPFKPINSAEERSSFKKQITMDKFIGKSEAVTSNIDKKRPQQSKIDIFVKWKDPSKKREADKARQKFFNNADVSGINDQCWAVFSEEAERKLEEIGSPAKKKPPKNKKRDPIKLPRKVPTTKTNAKDFSKKSVVTPSDTNTFEDAELEDQIKSRRNLLKKVMNKNKNKDEDGSILQKVQNKNRARLADGQVIRKKEDRERMHANDCPCCKGYYDALGLSPNSRQKRIQQSSRHRYVENPKPTTPEHYWDLGFPSSSERRRRRAARNSSVNHCAPKKLF